MRILLRLFRRGNVAIKDSIKRSVVKAISWRILATATTIALVYIATGELSLSLGIGLIEVVVKIIFYYIHERLWNQTQWGREGSRIKPTFNDATE